MSFTILPGMYVLIHSPAGPVARKLESVADAVLAATDVSLSVPWGGSRSRNDAPGPPRERTGALRKSLMHTPATLVGDELQVTCAAPAPIRRNHSYAEILLKGEEENLTGPYKFILDEDLRQVVES